MDNARRDSIVRWAIVAVGALALVAVVGEAIILKTEPPPLAEDTLVFIAPHPDDETYSAAMTLAANAREGRDVVLVLCTDGEGSKDAQWWIDTYAEDLDRDGDVDKWDFGLARRAEFAAAMGVLGVTQRVYLGAAGTQGATGIRDGELTSVDIAALVSRLARRYPDATFATVMKEIPEDHYLGDVEPHDDHAALCDAVHSWANEAGQTAYFFKPYASMDVPWYRRGAPHRIQGDRDLQAQRLRAVECYSVIGQRSWTKLYNAAGRTHVEYMVTSEEF